MTTDSALRSVVFAGGGTGGHLYPAIAIATALRERGVIAHFIGTADRLEARIVPEAGYALSTIASRPLPARPSLEVLLTLYANAAATVKSVQLLRRFRPDMVIATGGYVCFPVVVAARVLRGLRLFDGPIALLEPNARPGRTNRLLTPLVDEVWTVMSAGDVGVAAKYVQTGIPVRASLRALPSRAQAIAHFGLSPERKTLLVMGGSQGARPINEALIAVISSDGLPQGWQVLHVTGERDYERVHSAIGSRSDIVLRPYLSDLADAYAAADFVLARAGASTLGELAAVKKAAILVPYPHATDGHQTANAARFGASGAALVASDRDLATGRLGAMLAEATAPTRFAELLEAASQLTPADPLATILARVDALVTRKKAS